MSFSNAGRMRKGKAAGLGRLLLISFRGGVTPSKNDASRGRMVSRGEAVCHADLVMLLLVNAISRVVNVVATFLSMLGRCSGLKAAHVSPSSADFPLTTSSAFISSNFGSSSSRNALNRRLSSSSALSSIFLSTMSSNWLLRSRTKRLRKLLAHDSERRARAFKLQLISLRAASERAYQNPVCICRRPWPSLVRSPTFALTANSPKLFLEFGLRAWWPFPGTARSSSVAERLILNKIIPCILKSVHNNLFVESKHLFHELIDQAAHLPLRLFYGRKQLLAALDVASIVRKRSGAEVFNTYARKAGTPVIAALRRGPLIALAPLRELLFLLKAANCVLIASIDEQLEARLFDPWKRSFCCLFFIHQTPDLFPEFSLIVFCQGRLLLLTFSLIIFKRLLNGCDLFRQNFFKLLA
ncbi:hypothetical protein KC356_g103 [Hortaea werneckii]|nr:hypothetical protein KC356_g103 [Hortaea werneckii]